MSKSKFQMKYQDIYQIGTRVETNFEPKRYGIVESIGVYKIKAREEFTGKLFLTKPRNLHLAPTGGFDNGEENSNSISRASDNDGEIIGETHTSKEVRDTRREDTNDGHTSGTVLPKLQRVSGGLSKSSKSKSDNSAQKTRRGVDEKPSTKGSRVRTKARTEGTTKTKRVKSPSKG